MEQKKAADTIYSNKTVMGLPVKSSFMFTNAKGIEKKGIKKRQLDLLKKLEFLPRFLKGDEEVYLVTTACSPISIMEQLTTGAIVFYIKRSILVFTNKRIIHIPTTVGYNFRHSFAQIQYNDIRDIKLSWGALKIRYANNKKERFIQIHRKERAKIKQFIRKLNFNREASKYQQRYHICPSCMRSLKKGEYRCAACGLEFKSSGRAQMLSLVIPGGGYFYTGHWFLGIMDFIVEASLIYLAANAYLNPDVVDVIGTNEGVLYLAILAVEKIMTIYHANHYVKEYIPVTTKYKQRVMA
jgi:hypothetical protein